MNSQPRYRVILHGPSSWKGAMKPPDVEVQVPFIVAFEPQNDLIYMQQGAIELSEVVIDDITCTTQVLSLFFFETREQAAEAQNALTRSLDRLQTVYDVFRNTRVLESLEQAIGSVHIPLETVANRIDVTGDPLESGAVEKGSTTNYEADSYNLRLAITQGLAPVNVEMDLIDDLRRAVARKGALVNRVSVSFYQLDCNRSSSIVPTPATANTPCFIRKSAKSTPRNITRGTTPCARAGKAVVDLYAKRGLVHLPTTWVSAPNNASELLAASPVLKAAVTSQKLERALAQAQEELRSYSHDMYVEVKDVSQEDKASSDNCHNVAQEPEDRRNEQAHGEHGESGIDCSAAPPPFSERLDDVEIDNAVDMALKLFDTWNFDNYEVLNLPEPVIQIPKASSRRHSINSDVDRVKRLEEENKSLVERNSTQMQEISRLQSQIDDFEINLNQQLNAVKLQHQIETFKLNEALKESEKVISNLSSSRSCVESADEQQSAREIRRLSQQIDTVVMEKQDLLSRVQSITEEKDSLTQELGSLKQVLSDYKGMENSINEIRLEQEGQMTVMRNCIAKLQKEKDKVASDLKKCKRENKKLTVAMESAERTEKELKDSVIKLEGDLLVLRGKENELSAANAQIKELRQELKDCRTRLELLTHQRADTDAATQDLRKQLAAAREEVKQKQGELEAECSALSDLKETLKHAESERLCLEGELLDAKSSNEDLRQEKAEALDKYHKEKMQHDSLKREHERKCNKLTAQVEDLSIKLDMMVHNHNQLLDAYAAHRINCSIKSAKHAAKIESTSCLNTGLVKTVLKTKAELARKRCQHRAVTRTLQLPDDATDKQILAELRKPKTQDSLTKQKINNYDRLKAAFTKLKGEKEEQDRLLEAKTTAQNNHVLRQNRLHEENRRLTFALNVERERVAALEAETKRQVQTVLSRSNEEKRLLYAKQCELMMQTEGMKDEIGVLKQQMTMLHSELSEGEGRAPAKSSKSGSVDPAASVNDKLLNMPNVFWLDGPVDRVRCRVSETTFDDGRSVDSERRHFLVRSIFSKSPSAYKDTKASLYSRKATLAKLKARQERSDEQLDSIHDDSSVKHKHPCAGRGDCCVHCHHHTCAIQWLTDEFAGLLGRLISPQRIRHKWVTTQGRPTGRTRTLQPHCKWSSGSFGEPRKLADVALLGGELLQGNGLAEPTVNRRLPLGLDQAHSAYAEVDLVLRVVVQRVHVRGTLLAQLLYAPGLGHLLLSPLDVGEIHGHEPRHDPRGAVVVLRLPHDAHRAAQHQVPVLRQHAATGEVSSQLQRTNHVGVTQTLTFSLDQHGRDVAAATVDIDAGSVANQQHAVPQRLSEFSGGVDKGTARDVLVPRVHYSLHVLVGKKRVEVARRLGF
ncbi:girdin isoform X1 [Babesia caballi]|uniref:Girdin isoform X1 n=1 Tax=Babesia caballi TaxID=5871 RepID=A0AAV4LT03_BABCB|nr:girdin isoform X1 [Babesia caballi]